MTDELVLIFFIPSRSFIITRDRFNEIFIRSIEIIKHIRNIQFECIHEISLLSTVNCSYS